MSFAQTPKNIIYEYEIITQKKGEPFATMVDTSHLSSEYKRLMKSLPVRYEALDDRLFRFAYEVQGTKKILREVNVTRGDRMANFLLTEEKPPRFISAPSKIAGEHFVVKPELISLGSSVELVSPTEKLFAMQVTQEKKQPLEEALTPLGLSSLQRNIIYMSDFSKSALSKRSLILYFAGSQKQKLLRGLKVVRGTNSVAFALVREGEGFSFRNVKFFSSQERQLIQQRFSRATVKTLAPPAKIALTKAATAAPKKTKTSTQENTKVSGKYSLVTLQQKKGQSLDAMIKKARLSKLQSSLLAGLPIIAQAKSDRLFHILFEKVDGRTLMKAVRVVRGSNVAEFVLANTSGSLGWFNKKGEGTTSSSFLRYPLTFKKMTSGFNLRRRHPISRRIRPHRGTDFAAPHGTPIWAPANGVVEFAGRQRGYGITLVIDHQNGYKTKYAHLSRILVKKGSRVKQRQIVARVGNTGASTGTHLHYEMIVNGRHRDAMKVKLPGSSSGKVSAEAKKLAAKYLPQILKMLK